jgi:hypothetical protein
MINYLNGVNNMEYVQFKPEIRRQLEIGFKTTTDRWISLPDGTGILYTETFLKQKFFEVKDVGTNCYRIFGGQLHDYNVHKRHVMPYVPIKLDLDDELFEWSE